MNFNKVLPGTDLSEAVRVLNNSHATVAKEFGFTVQSNPTNSAFIDAGTLESQLNKGIELFLLMVNEKAIGCIAIEKSTKEIDTFYIEKVSVIPEYRHKGHGIILMGFAIEKIRSYGGKWVSIALIDSNAKLKKWYLMQGFVETGIKDFPQLPFRVCFMNKHI